MTMKTENTIVAVNQWNANFSQTIQKELVHKDFLSEVFLTDSKQITSDCFLISAYYQKHIFTTMMYLVIFNNLMIVLLFWKFVGMFQSM